MDLHYKKLSKIYDLIDILYFKRWQHSPRKAILALVPDGNVAVLDVCSGTGTNSLLIAKNRNNCRVTGIDIAGEMLAIGRDKAARELISNVNFLAMDATRTSFDEGAFDIAVISLVLHEMDKNQATKILAEAKRILSKSGKLIVVEWEQPKTFFRKIVFSTVKAMESKGFPEFLKQDFERYFAGHGLSIKSSIACDYSRVFELVTR
jgi:demethylmenaquinone methyltransferase/2-methoxy-6-polyprenyl-1,4-benzoquinol methylase